MKNSLLVPVTDIKSSNKNQLHRLLKSIVEGYYEECGWEIVLVYDACDRVFVTEFKKTYPTFTHLEHSWNRLNFARNVNIGLRYVYSKKSNVLVVNQDCILPSVDTFIKTLNKFPENKEEIILTAQAVNLNLENVENPQKALNLVSRKIELEEMNCKFPFYCVYIGYKVLEQIGILDGVYVATFEDDDYITRALLKGIKIYRSGIKVYHEGSFIETAGGEWESASGSYNQSRLNVNLVKYVSKYQVKIEEVLRDDGSGVVDHNKIIPWILKNKKWNEEMIVR